MSKDKITKKKDEIDRKKTSQPDSLPNLGIKSNHVKVALT
jgi:hypothetical protein